MKKYLSRLLALLLSLVLLVTPASALTVEQALELLEEWYYYDIPDAAYEAETLDELFGLLGDPYTAYMTEEEYRAFLGLLEGEVGLSGIGVSIQYTDEGILVESVLPGGSAEAGGILAGDLIVEVEGVSCVPADAERGSLLTGEEGTKVTLTVLRDGREIQYTLTRRPVVIPNTQAYLLEGRVGYIGCNSFGLDTGNEVGRILKQYESQVDRWILDLRGNGGGYTDAAIDMLNALCGPGYYLYFEDGSGALAAVPGIQRMVSAKPVIVLTDGGSASASELVAGNMRDEDRGILVGSRTYGKGVAQSMLDGDVLPDYFDGDSMKLTTYRFYTENFNTTDKIGVVPTLLVGDVYTAAVALALCGGDSEAHLSIVLGGGSVCYIDPDTDEDTLAALLEALPPQARVYYREDGSFAETTVAEAAEKLGVEYDSRWFADVEDSDYARAINALGTYQMLNGTGGGNFSPKGELTRAQLCAMLARALGLNTYGASRFSDVPWGSWYAGSVNAVAAAGLVEGTGNGKFSPDDPLTQEQFLTIMGRVARFINVQIDAYGDWVEEKDSHLDQYQRAALKPYSDWARSGAAVLAWGLEDALDEDGDMLYKSLDKLSPKKAILREEAAAGMYAVLSGLGILP